MENKYYTPEIEDIFIGYEMETCYCKQDWEKYIVGDEIDAAHFFESYTMDAYPTEYRTPFLTKEQIEKEGWIEDWGEPNTLNEHFFYKDSFKDKTRRLTLGKGEFHDKIIPYIRIFSYWENPHDILYKYQGFCPSINEFRKICKLLGI